MSSSLIMRQKLKTGHYGPTPTVNVIPEHDGNRVNNWRVHDENYFTDHKLISFTLNFQKQPPGIFRNFK